MRTGPLSYNSAYELLRARGYEPVPGSSRFQNAAGDSGRILDAGGRGDTWYAEMEGETEEQKVGDPCPTCGAPLLDYGAHGATCEICAETEERALAGEFAENGSGGGTFAEGFAAGRRDREAGHVHQLCTTGTGERPPVVKRQGRDYYHGYKAAAEGATSEPSAYLAYRAKHRGMSGMAANGGEWRVNFGNGQVHDVRSKAEGQRYIDGLDRYREYAFLEHYEAGSADDPGDWFPVRGSKHAPNPIHLKLDGNFSFGIGSEDDRAMKKNASAEGLTESEVERAAERISRSEDWFGRWKALMVGTYDTGRVIGMIADAAGAPTANVEFSDVVRVKQAIDRRRYPNPQPGHTRNPVAGHCRLCGESLPPGEVLCEHHERDGLSGDPRWADLPSWEEARGRIHGGQHSLAENAADDDRVGFSDLVLQRHPNGTYKVTRGAIRSPEVEPGVVRSVIVTVGNPTPLDALKHATMAHPYETGIVFLLRSDGELSQIGNVVNRRFVPGGDDTAASVEQYVVEHTGGALGHEPNARGSKAWFGSGEMRDSSARTTWIRAKHARDGTAALKRWVKEEKPSQFYTKYVEDDDSFQVWYTGGYETNGAVDGQKIKEALAVLHHEERSIGRDKAFEHAVRLLALNEEEAGVLASATHVKRQTPNWRMMLDLPGVERRLGADRVAAVLGSDTAHAVALGLANDASDANDVGAYEAYTSLARMIDDGEMDDLITAARGRA